MGEFNFVFNHTNVFKKEMSCFGKINVFSVKKKT